MKLKHLISALSLALSCLCMNTALAHGAAKALHGGIVQMVNDIGFELVAQPDGATLYLMDHDKPMASKGITGKLTVLQGSNKIEADIKEIYGGDYCSFEQSDLFYSYRRDGSQSGRMVSLIMLT